MEAPRLQREHPSGTLVRFDRQTLSTKSRVNNGGLRDRTATLIPGVVLQTVLSQLEQDFALEQGELADAIGVSSRTLARWYAEDAYPQREARQRLNDLIALDQRLLTTFTEQAAVHKWLRTDNRYLGSIKPVEALKVGRIDRVKAALEVLDSGVFL